MRADLQWKKSVLLENIHMQGFVFVHLSIRHANFCILPDRRLGEAERKAEGFAVTRLQTDLCTGGAQQVLFIRLNKYISLK